MDFNRHFCKLQPVKFVLLPGLNLVSASVCVMSLQLIFNCIRTQSPLILMYLVKNWYLFRMLTKVLMFRSTLLMKFWMPVKTLTERIMNIQGKFVDSLWSVKSILKPFFVMRCLTFFFFILKLSFNIRAFWEIPNGNA